MADIFMKLDQAREIDLGVVSSRQLGGQERKTDWQSKSD